MKRLILSLFLCPLLASTANAAWLACDIPTFPVTSAEVEITSGTSAPTIVKVTPVATSTDLLLLDLAPYPPDNYTFRARFVGTDGKPGAWSEPLQITPPPAPSNLRLINRDATTPAMPTTDIDGKPIVGAPDIGAHEFHPVGGTR